MDSTPKKVFYQDSGYPIERNLVDVPLKGYVPTKKIVFLKVLAHIHYKLWGTNQLLSNSHWELFKRKNSLWHFFNGISFGKTPWVVTYETSLPRWNVGSENLLERGIKALAAKPCKQLIALSQCTKKFQIQYLDKYFPSFTDHISKKMTVIHPMQQPLMQRYEEKELADDTIIFTLIGADFFRKGGKEILTVFDRLFQQKAPVELHIISSLNYGDYASKATIKDLRYAKSIIRKHPIKIHHYVKLSNPEVLEKLKYSHIGLLPTYGDTYGYSVLEAQACGCPVITTNLRALPEINNNDCGWLIDVPKNRWGNGVLDTSAERSQFSDVIRKRLYEIICNILSDRAQIAKKGRLCLKKIREDHNPESRARQLEQIYDNALA